MLNQRFVLYRNSHKWVLKDQCPHGAALLGGEKVTVSVVPIMDGNSRGRCIDIPANAPETPILKKSALRLYPVQENMVLSGCFMETYQKQNVRQFHPFQNLKELVSSFLRLKVNTTFRVLENSIDISHLQSMLILLAQDLRKPQN